MTTQSPALSEAQKQVAKQLARIKGGRLRWYRNGKRIPKEERSEAMRKVALAKGGTEMRERGQPVPPA